MTEHERELRQIALLEAYERSLHASADAPPPPDLDPALATTARLLAREFGTVSPARAAAPTAAFRDTLRQRLQDQAASYHAVPARIAPPAVGDNHRPAIQPNGQASNHAPTTRRRASFRERDLAGNTPPALLEGAEQSAQPTPTAPKPAHPLRTAFSTTVGWLGAAAIILIVALAATLLLRGLSTTTPALQPTALPSPSVSLTPSVAPASPAITATPRQTVPLWQATGAMAQPRAQHSATRLGDGRVLVAGGYGAENGAASAEIYDPQTGRWSPTGTMGAARIDHSALLLPDGQVLVAGGFNNTVNNNTTSIGGAERYDPATGQWRPTAAPPVGLGLVRLGLLVDGRALVVASPPVGTPPEQWVFTALIYDPAADQWSSLGTLAFSTLPTVVTLADGRALLLGMAEQQNDGTTPAVILDPASGQSTPAPLPDARLAYAATRLVDGTVLVSGGRSWSDQGSAATTAAFRFDPATNRWTPGVALGTPRANHTTILLADGRVLAIGGNTNASEAATSAELYDPQTDRWTMAGILESNARAGFAIAPLADGRALVIGGDAGSVRSEYLASVELFTPPARGTAPSASSTSATPTTLPKSGIVDWNSPSAGMLFHNGRGYQAIGPTPPYGVEANSTLRQIGTTVLRWQSGGVFEARTPIYAVGDTPAETILALKEGEQPQFYTYSADTTALLASMQVVWGTVQGAGTTVCATQGCPTASASPQPNASATAYRVRIDRKLQGNLSPGATIEVRQLGVPARPWVDGGAVLLFVQPAQQFSTYGYPAGDYFWTRAGWGYRVNAGQITPNDRSPDDFYGPPDRFEAAIADLFRPVTPRPVPTLTGTWRAGAPLDIARSGHTLTMLRDGTVLLVGGYTSRGYTSVGPATVTLRYDPTADRWTPAGSLNGPRWGHAAVALQDGRVLIVGGTPEIKSNDLATAEVYDPATDRWTPIAPLPTPLFQARATLLRDGRALLVGTTSNDGTVSTLAATLYDPASNQWSAPAQLPASSSSARLTLPNGRVFLAANGAQRTPQESAAPIILIFEPIAGVWQTRTPPQDSLVGAAMTLLPDGTVMVVGGGETLLPRADRYDPAADRWTALPPMPVGRSQAGIVTLTTGQVLVVDGDRSSNNPSGIGYTGRADLYDPVGNRWLPAGAHGEGRTEFGLIALPNGRAMVVGGGFNSGNSFLCFDRVDLYSASPTPTPGP